MKPPLVTSDLVDYLREHFPLTAVLKASSPVEDLAQLNQLRGSYLLIEHLATLVRIQERRARESSTTI